MKKFISSIPRSALSVLLALAPLSVGAVLVEPGAELPVFALNDQHDKPVLIGPATRCLVFAAEKSVNEFVTRLFEENVKSHQKNEGLVYVSDISAMPAMISRMFAIPKLRELPFQVALARQASLVADLPRRAGFATVLTIRSGKVTQVQYAQTEAQLRQAIVAAQ
ncbi:MAG: hypothetical protein KJ614_18055 [Gammaproteobacteria bacterium]|uniref:hypothetical protein n=1 Tax=Rhodoferax sp. TaxID=50421 RepID=UPI00185BF1D3|nr:hypothetical protein [Rhodoferax sp.]MBU3900790.1 hypothetical protein [Gammaproteobacteria bacterium]MBA3056665.1 hypothetical protein [Rhodoferax sp.]MBU3997171.1 hypothetical protein [Gammaproteobacteria bacterium]MBU4079541.1 hypothetical protein [Gammaproteobacteria bacterium]MBU4114751.1 hypothetical protein [Gammaproteobacteria bacterium]